MAVDLAVDGVRFSASRVWLKGTRVAQCGASFVDAYLWSSATV